MSVEVLNETEAELDSTEFVALARYVLGRFNVHPQADLSITMVDTTTMGMLHERWMGDPAPTDVMAFPMDEVRPGEPGNESEGILGDVVLCPQVAATNARRAGHSPIEEMLLLTVHGILHLLGFDHAEKEEELVMFTLQRELLLTFLATKAP
ncbi:MAG: rRNA maturation RNase YbeY [Bifidobacteriaceae bacterium]|jgi:probable rRNA maturation factor|nr:rRNA maturation RNase YbeY [Bifidobacteriaceae bacterium]